MGSTTKRPVLNANRKYLIKCGENYVGVRGVQAFHWIGKQLTYDPREGISFTSLSDAKKYALSVQGRVVLFDFVEWREEFVR